MRIFLKNYKTSRYSFFLIIPIGILLISILHLKSLFHFYYWSFDPAYPYLFNGMNIANGSFSIGHTDHPGTPLQVLIALVIKITHIISGSGGDLTHHVLNNPEHYLTVVSYVIIGMNVLVIYFIGVFYYKKTGNKTVALSLQLIPLMSQACMMFLPIPMTEPVYLLSILVIVLITVTEIECRCETSIKKIFLLALLSGLALATKISILPVLLFPFLSIKGWRRKLIYVLLIPVSFILFTLPIIKQYPTLFKWVKNLFLHSQSYGGGEKNIIDFGLFISNLQQIFSKEYLFTSTILLFFGFQIFLLIKKSVNRKSVFFKPFLAINLAIFIQIIIVAKHYSFHYLIPIQLLFIPGFIILFKIIKAENIFTKQVKLINIKYNMVFLFGFVLFMFVRLAVFFELPQSLNIPGKKTVSFIEEKLKNEILVIEQSYNQPLPFQEYAMFFGATYAGKDRNKLFSECNALYPDVFFYNKVQDRIHNWKGEVSIFDLPIKENSIVYSFNEQDSLAGDLLKNNLILSKEILYRNEETGDCFYRLIIDSVKLSGFDKKVILCDMEDVSNMKNRFNTNVENITLSKGILQDSSKMKSGNYSANLTNKIYGPSMRLGVKGNDHVKVSIYYFPAEANGALVASLKNSKGFYKSTNVNCEKDSLWGLMEMSFEIPSYIKNDTLTMYMLNNKHTVFIDDFKVEHWMINN